MSSVTIDDLRRLRREASQLNATLAKDLRPFWSEEGNTFRRLPTSDSDPNPTTTCSCLMALGLTHRLADMYGEETYRAISRNIVDQVMAWPWESSGLEEGNRFTTSIVLRTVGLLQKVGVLETEYWETTTHTVEGGKERRLPDIARELLAGVPDGFKILPNSSDPASMTFAYWWTDSVARVGNDVVLDGSPGADLCRWATYEFARQQSLVVAGNEALMDPVEMAMGACLCAKLRHLAERSQLGLTPSSAGELPTRVELEHSLVLLMSKQTTAGIWPKYFPLFSYHYGDQAERAKKGGGGSNYCFTFEMLEAVVSAFGESDTLFCENPSIFKGIEKALKWCRENRLTYFHGEGELYRGWHSGGQKNSLSESKPESWATAVVHMFLWELQDALARRIRNRVLQQYGVPEPLQNDEDWSQLLPIDIQFPAENGDNVPATVRDLFQEDVIRHAEDTDPVELLRAKLKCARSALLFGPPGTSKTRLATVLARRLGWAFLKFDPSHFLTNGLDQIYSRANEIFDDLMDLSGVVVFFDEMDALVYTRSQSTGALDMTRQFLTTCMLPKLADLHARGRVIFLMATNHRSKFDQAITRPGRFDLLVCMGPPSWQAKSDQLEMFFREYSEEPERRDEIRNEAEVARGILADYVGGSGSKAYKKLDLMTFAEFETFVASLRRGPGPWSLAERLQEMGKRGFLRKLARQSRYATLRLKDKWDGHSAYAEYLKDRKESRRQTQL